MAYAARLCGISPSLVCSFSLLLRNYSVSEWRALDSAMEDLVSLSVGHCLALRSV